MAKRYWLMKSEPDVFSFDDLKRSPEQTTCWDGVRNYQARNLLRDEMTEGDGVLFYHSRINPPSIVGLAQVVKAGYPDHTQFDSNTKYYDEKAKRTDPRWYMVDIVYDRPLARPLSLHDLKKVGALERMTLLQKGSRLSVQPVSAFEWETILKLGGLES